MFAWGEYNRALGWQPVYLAARGENDEITAMMLGLLRRYPLGVGLLWCAGGPVGDLSELGADFYQTLTKATKLKRLYCRFRCDRERNIRDVLALNRTRLDAFVVYNAFELDDGTRSRSGRSSAIEKLFDEMAKKFASGGEK